MKLFTDRLILRQAKAKDAQELRLNINNLNVVRYTSRIPYPYKLKDAKSYIKRCAKDARKRKRENYELVIELKSGKQVIGGAGFIGFDRFNQKATIGYWLGEKYWRQGYASEAMEAVIRFAFKRLKIRRLEANVYCRNRASIKVLERFGFKKEGLKRQAFKARATGKWHDTFFYALLKSDYKV